MGTEQGLVVPETVRVLLTDGSVEELPMDEYLKGVVPSEMGLKKPVEALKAQAVAARSFAAVTRRHAIDGFDVCCTTHCQVYKPEKRYADSDRAVDETSGWIATYGSRPITMSYFGHCDGRTRNSEEVWTQPVDYLRSVPCICGYSSLFGHGVGMCQRGAAAMASQQNATFQDILSHYYTGIQLVQAQKVPRSTLCNSIIMGRVTNGLGKGRAGQKLVLSGPPGSFERGTTTSGQFWFTTLPAGRWQLSVKGRPVLYPDLFTDGRSSVELEIAVPDVGNLRCTVTPLPGTRRLAGSLGFSGVPITVAGPSGQETTVLSGSSTEFKPGGFEVPVQGAGSYTIRFLDRSFNVDVAEADGGRHVQFSTTK